MIEPLRRRAARYPGPTLALSCLLLVALAWRNRFVQDDAFISFQYAANLVAGRGLTWLPGERVEGYTNFLWTLIMSVPIGLGLDPIRFSQGLGILLFVGTLLATERLARRLLGSRALALLAVWLLGTHYTFSAYATGGLETQLQTFLLTAAWVLAWGTAAVDDRYALRLAGVSLLAAAALLTRLDSAIPITVLYAALLWRLARATGEPRLRAVAALVLPALVVVGAWVAWKVRYYGDLLPNTFYAKTGLPAFRQGIKYLLVYVGSYWLQPFVFGLLASAGILLRRAWSLALLATLALWCAYVVRVGGDFMEFRLMVPILPLLMILAAWMIGGLRPRPARVALVALAVAGSAVHAVRFAPSASIDSIPGLARYVEDPERGWILAGRVLGQRFGGGEPPVMLATTAAGAIPYYSSLPTLDMHGLTDRRIARHGRLRDTTRPGHQRTATLDDLLQHRVNLVIGHPRIDPLGPDLPRYTFEQFVVTDRPDQPIPSGTRFVVVPLNPRYALTVLELLPSARVDRVVEREGLTTYAAARP